jgi:SOS response regulatory protein OraA/RecX
MNKLIKNLMIAAAISVAIVGAYTPATASANGGSWQRDSVGWWYKEPNGNYINYPRLQWRRIDGKWYYFDIRGYIIHSKWELINGHWYYFNTSGHMIENTWKMIGDKWYYFDTKGHMLSEQWVGDYYVGRDGDMLKNAITLDDYLVGSDGKWDRRFSRELVKNFRTRDFCGGPYSKSSAISAMVHASKPNDYDTALQLFEIACPNYNPVDAAKRIIKVGVKAYSNEQYTYSISKSHLIENTINYHTLPKETVEKAFDELGREINFSEFFKNQAIKALKSIDSLKHPSRVQGERHLTERGFTKEEIDNAFKSVKIDFVKNAQHVASTLLGLSRPSESSRSYTINCLIEDSHFTKDEAEKGVDRLNYDFKINIRNWMNRHSLDGDSTQAWGKWAKLYSKNHIIYHLTQFEKFAESEVREVLAEYNINYTERARLQAIDILKIGKYSRSNLIKTLTDQWKFTKEEATNAVKDLKHENLID